MYRTEISLVAEIIFVQRLYEYDISKDEKNREILKIIQI